MNDPLPDFTSALAGAYIIEREFDGGGMSRVFVARERALDRQVVIKVLSPDTSASLSAERFNREIQLAARLQHPHIVPVLNAGDANGVPYYTMPFVEGESLRERLLAGPLAVAESSSILRDVAKALDYAHARGIVHRDIKPGNVLLTGDSAAVTDFGIAKAISAARTSPDVPSLRDTGATLTMVGTSLGTPAYMAPEQAAGDPNADHRADIYAFGCLAYEMFTGGPVFGVRPSHQMIVAHIGERPAPIAGRCPALPAAIASLVMQCLEKDPGARPQSARELVKAFDTSSVPQRRTARSRVAAIAIASAIVVMGTGIMVFRGGSATIPPSVAVIPLDLVGADTALRYLSDGLTDEITSALSQMPLLQVAARGSAYAYRGASIDAKKASAKLGVRNILELSVRQHGDSLNVNADLIDGETGLSRWSQTLRYPMTRLGVVHDSVAHDIALVLNRGSHVTAQGTRHEPSREAAELYLRGRYATDLGTRQDLEQAIVFFKRARQMDTVYAQAYASEATAWSALADAYLPPDESYAQADTLSRRALALDSTIAESYANLAWVDLIFHHDWTEAERKLRHAIALNPNDAVTHNYYGQFLGGHGEYGRAIDELRNSIRLDPANAWFLWTEVGMWVMRSEPDSAIVAERRVNAISPGFFYNEAFAADAYRMKGDVTTAFRLDSAAARVSGRPTSGLVLSLIALGRRDDAEQQFRLLEQARSKQYIAAEIIGRAAVALGHRDRALYWFRRGFAEHSLWFTVIARLPDMRHFRTDPEFAAMMRDAGMTFPADR